MKVLTWNINFRTADALEPLLGLSPLPDVITLQEVTHEHADAVSARLKDRRYDSVYSGNLNSSEKSYGNVVAARKLEEVRIPASSRFPWPQLVCHAAVATDAGPVHAVTVHVPNGSGNGWKKIDTLDALRQLVLGLKGEPLVLTGDFNEPRYAMQDGQVVTWGKTRVGGAGKSGTGSGRTRTASPPSGADGTVPFAGSSRTRMRAAFATHSGKRTGAAPWKRRTSPAAIPAGSITSSSQSTSGSMTARTCTLFATTGSATTARSSRRCPRLLVR